ncbi:60S acidic ribosomal protein P1 [Camelus dromedarius]|uniref:60S acidic ribosomal protein P1 n=1 Tax=Camelus dromedarius TaxID=9838 RepID=A0A5N4BZP9_CAMDR|nr:60S acidic ribosomal protein P1 [Camelus dromedarius]
MEEKGTLFRSGHGPTRSWECSSAQPPWKTFFQGSQGRVGARPSLPPGPARRPAAPAHSSPVPRPRPKLAYIYPALTMHDNEVMVTEGKVDALIKAAGLVCKGSGESLYRSLVCNVGAGGGGPAPARGGPAPSTTAVPAEDEKVEAEKEESEESDDDVGFGLFD